MLAQREQLTSDSLHERAIAAYARRRDRQQEKQAQRVDDERAQTVATLQAIFGDDNLVFFTSDPRLPAGAMGMDGHVFIRHQFGGGYPRNAVHLLRACSLCASGVWKSMMIRDLADYGEVLATIGPDGELLRCPACQRDLEEMSAAEENVQITEEEHRFIVAVRALIHQESPR